MLFYFAKIAKQELSHAMIFHDMALAEVNKAKDAGKEPTEEMQKVWDCMHVEYVDKVQTLEYKLGRL